MHCETLQWENPLCRFDLQRLLINVYVFTVHGCHSKDMTLVFKPFRVVETIKLNLLHISIIHVTGNDILTFKTTQVRITN